MHPLSRSAMLIGVLALLAVLSHPAAGKQELFSPSVLARAAETRPVMLAVQRDHELHVFDGATLEPLETVTLNVADSVQPRPDGRMLFIRQTETPDGNSGCCALSALDLATFEMCRLIFPSSQPVPVTDDRVFSQRGNTGIDVFDAQTLARLPTIAAPGVYSLFPSPDGRWLFGANHFREATLDLIDVRAGVLVRRLMVVLPDVDGGSRSPRWFTGAWLDGQFYLYASDGAAAYLWGVTPDTTKLGPPSRVTVVAPNLTANALPAFPSTLVASDGRLFVYEPRGWWFKVPGRIGLPGGGVFALDPESGAVTAQLAADLDFAQVVPSGNGHQLVGLTAGDPRGNPAVTLLVIDAESGTLLASRTLAPDVWSIAAAGVPETLLPLGTMQPAPCSHPEPALSPPAPRPQIAPK